MFLKSLTLKGFKSFADATTLDFQPGITVVVGPNGSGKSNVVDAVAWVLGAQGPKTLRSTKMEDVIFAGTANRPALGRAEVSLTIDNAAGLLPIDFTEVTITRTLFRSSGESEYAINGVPCRLLDVQELLSDSGVGRQQHVIVSQGQLDAVLNARPEERRLIIEEAAGVLKYRRRREKAQRRLESTEGNVLRLQDLLREVRRQLRPLERQADAARSHGALVEELEALRLHLIGRELGQLRLKAEGLARQRGEHAAREGGLRHRLADLDAGVIEAEAALAAAGGDADLGDALVRYETLRERARGLTALLAERLRGVERDRTVSIDRGVVASLEAESARLAAELAEVEQESAVIAPRYAELSAAEADLAVERQTFESQWGDGIAAPTGEASEIRGELVAMRGGVERDADEVARLQTKLDALGQKAAALADGATRLRAEVAAAGESEPPLVAAVDVVEAARADADATLGGAEESRRRAEADRAAWVARAEALSLALDEARARAGAERLSGLDGVVGTLLDLVEVDDGWEAAVEAALGEAVAAVVVANGDVARAALARLHDAGAPGAVLALGAAVPPPAVVAPGEPLRARVRGRGAEVDRLLDALLAGAVGVDGGWQEALDLAVAHPGCVAVTRQGDRFAATGWRAGAGATGATGAALDEANAQAETAAQAAVEASVAVDVARSRVEAISAEVAERAAELDANDARMSATAEALGRIEAEKRDAATEDATLRQHLEDMAERLARQVARVDELEARLPALEADETMAVERQAGMRHARDRMEERAAAVGALRVDLEVRAAGLEERRTFLSRRLTEVDERLARNTAERDSAEHRRHELDALAVATTRLAAMVSDRSETVERVLVRLRARHTQQSAAARAAGQRLEALRKERHLVERELAEVRERQQRTELDEAENRLRLEQAVEGLRRDFDREPDAVIGLECPELPPGTTAPNRVRELERELRLMGPVNPLALEEFTALQERHTFLEGQMEDVRSSRRELAKVIKAIDAEIVQVFAAAYADVAENFAALFETLFPGGHGTLRLTEPENPLETGIEIEARPSGKNVKKLSLLSGGERSLTALAFLFAVFRSRPSPFYLLDEVEAALDDVNLHRFLDLLHEFRDEAQLLVVSHQKRTMEAADCLYGVTMQPGGSSKVVSERVGASA